MQIVFGNPWNCLTFNFAIVIEQFMALLILRHTLPLMIGGNGEYSFALFSVRFIPNVMLRL